MWHYTIDNNPQDPVDEATISQLIANGTIHANTLVWREGMADWITLSASELAPAAVPAASPAAVPQRPGPVRRPAGQAAGPVTATQIRQTATNPYATPQTAPQSMQRVPASAMSWKQILFGFEGRIPRRIYWAGLGIWIGIMFVVGFMMGLLAQLLGEENAVFAIIPIFLVLIPYLWSAIALQVKRWHDRGKPGVMVLINFIPLVGPIWAFVECGCMRGTMGPNPYGEDPT